MSDSARRHGIARVLSKIGVASRTTAATWVRQGRVQVNGRVVRDPEHPTRADKDHVHVDGKPIAAAQPIVLMLNKPRGLVTSAKDERGRDTVYNCFEGADLPWLAPVGRLDKASEGLLLFSNDPSWAAKVTEPATGPDKTYRVQVATAPDDATLALLRRGVRDAGETLRAKSVTLVRSSERTAWLEVVLDEGKNRQIRRMLEVAGIEVLRLIRIRIGRLALGALAKGAWRHLTAAEIASLVKPRHRR